MKANSQFYGFLKNFLLISVSCLIAVSHLRAQSAICVSTIGDDINNGSAASPYRNIQTALDNASSGDTIKVASGTYSESLTTKVSVVLLGGYNESFSESERDIFQNKTIIEGVSANMYTDYKGSTTDGFIFTCNSSVTDDALRVAANSYVSHNIVQGLISNAGNSPIDITGGAVVINNIFKGGWFGMRISSGTGIPVIRNNIVTGSTFGVYTLAYGDSVRTYNDVYGNTMNYSGTTSTPGTGDISKNFLFKNKDDNDYRILENSPCRDAGDPTDQPGDEPSPYNTRIDIGAYGGTKYSPYLPPIPDPPVLKVPANNSTELPRNPVLKWNKIEEVGTYHVQVSGDQAFTTEIIYDTASITDTLIQISGLSLNTTYYWRVNASVTLGTSNWSEVFSFTTMPVPQTPTIQASNIIFSDITKNSVQVQWTKGNGIYSIVFINRETEGIPEPVDYTTYLASSNFGTGSQIGTSGWYCVYLGTDSVVTITSLAAMTDHKVMVITLNGNEGDEKYLTETADNNPSTFTTLCDYNFYSNNPLITLYHKSPDVYDIEISFSHSCGSETRTFEDISTSSGSFYLNYPYPNSGYLEGSLSPNGNSFTGTYNISFAVLNPITGPVPCGTKSGNWFAGAAVPMPSQPSDITGNTVVCEGIDENFSVTDESGVRYIWTASGGTVTGSGSSVTVTWDTAGAQILTVTPSNNCKTGPGRNIEVQVITVPSQPSDIAGNSTVCLGVPETYSITGDSGVIYNWTASGGTVTGSDTSVSVTWDMAGTQTLTVGPSNDCGNGESRILELTVNDCSASAEDLNKYDFIFNPNPVEDKLYFKGIEYEVNTVTILSTDGKILKQITEKGIEQIDVSDLQSGVYIITVVNSKSSISKKLIIQ